MANEPAPLWKRAFDAAEKAVAPKLEAAVRTEQFAETASALTKLQSKARTQAKERSQQAMHNWNLPTATDISRLREQVTSLERAVRDLTKQVQALQGALPTEAAEPSQAPKARTIVKKG